MKSTKQSGQSKGMPLRRSLAYGLAIAATAVTLGLRLALDKTLGGQPTLVVFTIPIMVSAYFGGLGPGLLATTLSFFAASYYLLPPINSFAVTSPVERWQQFLVLLCGFVISLLNEALHRARHRAAESDEMFVKGFQLSPDCLVITRLSDRIVLRANDALCRLWGNTAEAIVGKPGLDHVKWVREDERLAFMQVLTERGESLDCEAAFRMTDGRLRDFVVSSRLIEVDGEPCALSVMRDVTEQNRGRAAAVRLASIVESSDDAIVGKTLEGVITSWNSGAERIFGYSAAEAVGAPMQLLIPPDRAAEEPEILARISRGEHVRHFETVRVRKDGRRIDVSATISPICDAVGRIVGASKIARDISAQKFHEREIARLTRLYAALSQVNQAIVLKQSQEELFDAVCRALVSAGGFGLAWIGRLDPTTRRIHPVAQAGDSSNFLHDIVIYADDRPEGRGLVGTAIRENRRRVCNDLAAEPQMAPWRERLERSAYASSGAFPIRQGGEIYGAMVVAAGEVNFFQDREIALLEEAASDVSFALDNFAREEARSISEVRYRTLFEYAPDGIVIADAASVYLDANASICRMLGYSRGELIGLHASDIVVPSEIVHIAPALDELKTKSEHNREWQFRRKDGSVFMAEVMVTAMPGGNLIGIIRDVTERRESQQKMREQLDELLRWQEAMLNREDRVQSLKTEVNELLGQRGEPPRYPGLAAP